MEKSPFPIIQQQLPLDEGGCCGSNIPAPSGEHALPGYELCDYVESFIETEYGLVPRVSTHLSWTDQRGRVRARCGILRNSYLVSPGLYGVGCPTEDSPVLVSANYKLSFDSLRRELSGINAWILVLDSRGINVWCAAAHKTFGSDELVRQIRKNRLAKRLNHRELIVPQLGASGVSAREVKKQSGFKVLWGPLRAGDIREYLRRNNSAEPRMRKLRFELMDRLVLVPVELVLALKPSLVILAALLLLSGIGPDIFSAATAWRRWVTIAESYAAGVFSGALLVPALLPFLPFRALYLKGLVAALPPALWLVWPVSGGGNLVAMLGPFSLTLAVSAYLAMNYSGATPFASPSGVEKEMGMAIPVQLLLLITALVCWLAEPFLG